MTRALVAYASPHGATGEIADAIGEELADEGITAEVRPVGEVDDVSGYDAFVIGSAIYIGRWRKDARKFLRKHRYELRRRPVWLFSSGPLDHSAEEQRLEPPKSVRKAMEKIGAAGHEWFGGALAPDADGMGKYMAKGMLDKGEELDYRDFDHIRAWARSVATSLSKS